MNPPPDVPILVGPTAVGKTELSLVLARELDAEIISADSRQVYKHLDIGTAKPTPEQQKQVTHHLIDFVALDHTYTAGEFAEDARELIKELLESGKTPLIVGGSGLYIKALTTGLFDTPSRDEAIRQALYRRAETEGREVLYAEFQRIDPDYANSIHPNNLKRIVRGLEIYQVTGKPPSHHYKNQDVELDYPWRIVGLRCPRETLHARINARVDQMIKDGLIQEVQSVLDLGYTGGENALQTVGYAEVITYLRGEYALTEAVDAVKAHTRQYAKRQMTWFRNQHEVTWFNRDDNLNPEVIIRTINEKRR